MSPKKGRPPKKAPAPAPQQGSLFDGETFIFGPRFLEDHAGHILTDPRTAVVELIANAYDAGASRVRVRWPENIGEAFEIEDDGTGMTRDELLRRWRTLSYNRLQEQGPMAERPPGSTARGGRAAFGRSGKGRHGAFCFAETYMVETVKAGNLTRVKVSLARETSAPFRVDVEHTESKDGHGTRIWTDAARGVVPLGEIRDVIGSKFLVDPEFSILINGERLELLDLQTVETSNLDVPDFGTVTIHQIEGVRQHRTTQMHGITWWVNRRMVGRPSWDGLDSAGAILDGRTGPARRYSFIIEADLLKEDVKADWTDFHASRRRNAVGDAVRQHVIRALEKLLASTRREKKKEALAEHRRAIAELPSESKRVLGGFVDDLVQRCPTLSQGDLSRMVEIFANLEQARSGYDLLSQLQRCSPDDLDTWNEIMRKWTARDAETVLSELEKRLTLIAQLQELVHSTKTDELHDLQPLFERGLWIFGPEYESVDFCSNRGMAHVIREFLGLDADETSRKRPDFVALPEASIGLYGAAAYADGGELLGYRKLLIVELKKGGFCVGQKELDQARDYAKELRLKNKIQPMTELVAYVLGATIEPGLEITEIGKNTRLIPMDYDTLLARAHSRTFNLQRRLKDARLAPEPDPEVAEVLAETNAELPLEPPLDPGPHPESTYANPDA